MSQLLEQLEGRERRAECAKHDADLLADLRHRAAYLRQPEIADFRIGDLAHDVAAELDRAQALAASHQRLKEALEAYANPLNWDVDEQGIRRVWLEPGGYPPSAYNGFELARAALKGAP